MAERTLERIEAELTEARIEAEVLRRHVARAAERQARPRRSKMSPKEISDFLTKYGSAEFAKLPR